MRKYSVMIFILFSLLFLASCEQKNYKDMEVKQKIYEDLYVKDDERNIIKNDEENIVKNDEKSITIDDEDSIVSVEWWEVNIDKYSQIFKSSGLLTNTDKTSIDLDLVLGGWPEKDWIPSIDNPEFYSIKDAEEKLDFLNNWSTWIAVEINWEAKFYPYNILVWHEIVNDNLWGENIAVTFCPLCGSAIVYNRNVDLKKIRFGVSWKLYESNLLMYDDVTESLWSQSLWEALVWEKLWKKLEYIQSDLMSFEEFKNNYSSWKILTDNTGARRNYSQIPYGNYTETDDLYFPVVNSDKRFQAKEMFYIVNNNGESVAFKFIDLREQKKAEITIWENNYSASFENGIVTVSVNWKDLAWYYEMWFSWATHNKWSKNIWEK